MRKLLLLCGVLLPLLWGVNSLDGTMISQTPEVARRTALKAMKDGNHADALKTLQRLATSDQTPGSQAAEDFTNAVTCLQHLGQFQQFDELLESVVAAHPDSWQTLLAAARALESIPHYGFRVAGEFHRGHHRGGGRQVHAQERDRVRALQLLKQGEVLLLQDERATALQRSGFYFQLAQLFSPSRLGAAWKLQDQTDLTQLPDYAEASHGGPWGRGFGGGSQSGAPVDEQGQPVLYQQPKSWDQATSDGERWRWALQQIVEQEPSRRSEIDLVWAQFLRDQFGVRRHRGGIVPLQSGNQDSSSDFVVVHKLADHETLAWLATGEKKIALPDEFNHLVILQQIIQRRDSRQSQALQQLIGVRMSRQQYPLAADLLQQAIELSQDPQEKQNLQQRRQQITGSWLQFESLRTQAAGEPAVVDVRFRNAAEVRFTARPIDISQLLTDTRNYLNSQPQRLEHQQVNLQQIGHRLLTEGQNRYLGPVAAEWSEKLESPVGHFDAWKTVTTPLRSAGAWWVEATVQGGNTSRIVLWIADTAITKKHIEQGTLYFVADAATGQPVPQADIEFFGFRQERIGRSRKFRVITSRFPERSDRNGLCVVNGQNRDGMQWATIVRTRDGRLAFDGFDSFWHAQPLAAFSYSPVKVYSMTDRPIYRPGHQVQYRLWVRQPRFHEDQARFANQPFVLQVRNPRGDTVLEQDVRTDRWGGIDGKWEVPDDAVLGQYTLAVCRNVGQKKNKPVLGTGSFRVEEYRKPEYEVTIQSPDRPVQLGDTIAATIQARYFFGAPVTQGSVHYKVERTKKDARWYPVTRWDWLYSPGYWWFTPDAAWYPGWQQWGCPGPVPPWIGWSPDPPEVVAEGDAEIGEDGTIAVNIDTAAALQQHSDSDHSYRITAQVVDQSRRTITATGSVLVTRQPFRTFVWTDRGHYRTGDTVRMHVQARTPDGQPVPGSGQATLSAITWDGDTPQEQVVETVDLQTAEDGTAQVRFVIPRAGQYRLSCRVTDESGSSQEAAQLLYVRGPDQDGRGYRFNDLEIIADQKHYRPGETARLQINTNHSDSTVLLFVRAANGVSPAPQVLRLQGKSTVFEMPIQPQDMPNVFVEAVTIADGRIHTTTKEIFVPPEEKVAQVEVVASQTKYRPGDTAEVTLKLTDEQGRPFVGNTVLTAFDASLEAIAASSIPEIRQFFWKSKRSHYPSIRSTLQRTTMPLFRRRERPMTPLADGRPVPMRGQPGLQSHTIQARGMMMKSMAAPQAAVEMEASADMFSAVAGEAAAPNAPVEPVVRSQFADTALWLASVDSNAQGLVTATFTVPDNLTTWKIRAWALGDGTRVGSGTTDVICSRNLIVRPQTPRFLTQTDQMTLSAVVHNYLDSAKDVQVVLETEGGQLRQLTESRQMIRVPAGGEIRVDWPVQAVASGLTTVRMKALTDEESDAAELTVPVQVHGSLKTESLSGVIRPDGSAATFRLQVPEQRRVEQTELVIRFSPTLAGAMLDALPYLVEYPYGCTEQTLNRFLPAVITQQTLQQMGVDLQQLQQHNNLNAQELPKSDRRWNYGNNPVFDSQEMQRIVRDGVQALTEMQLQDGGWGWFSGYGEHSSAHLTALIVHGLITARQADVPILPDVTDRGMAWLKNWQARELEKLREGDRRRDAGVTDQRRTPPWKMQASNLDALVAWVLAEQNSSDPAVSDYLYRDRAQLSVYGKCLAGLVLHQQGRRQQRDMVLQNVEQFLQQDDENQTAWLELPGSSWWHWYGSETEAHAMYLRLLLKVRPQDATASRIVKYLLNNRRAAGHWSSTRDTAMIVESMAEYMRVTGENQPDMSVEVLVDGVPQKQVRITAENLFQFDGTVTLAGDAVAAGERHIEIRRTGNGPVYFNAYLTCFTLEDPITAAGLEVKVQRRYFRLERDDQDVSVRGDRGQAVHQQTTRWKRIPLESHAQLTSGDLVEVELVIDSKNDYEYLLLEDRKPGGFEPDDQLSGYVHRGLRAYRELRDDRVSFFLTQLARGRHSVSYRLRAETPGRMSALPARIEGMYAPELVGNSHEFKLQVQDQPTSAEKQATQLR